MDIAGNLRTWVCRDLFFLSNVSNCRRCSFFKLLLKGPYSGSLNIDLGIWFYLLAENTTLDIFRGWTMIDLEFLLSRFPKKFCMILFNRTLSCWVTSCSHFESSTRLLITWFISWLSIYSRIGAFLSSSLLLMSEKFAILWAELWVGRMTAEGLFLI